MSLFHSKIDPFSSYTINLGPLYVERVFDSLLTREGVKDVFKMGDMERLGKYLGYLKQKARTNNRIQYTFIQFYKAHFYHQSAHHSHSRKDVQHLGEKALCYYQTYLELSDQIDESKYYAQWQIGMLQDLLKYPWMLVEDALLKAGAVDPLRGEATKKIIEHYIQAKEWKMAHHYSQLAMNKFWGKNPVAQRRWFVDFDAYDWHIVIAHRTICNKLGYSTEKFSADGIPHKEAIPQQDQF